MVLIVMSVMGGWLDMVKKQARGLLGDVVVDNADYGGFPLYQEFIDEIQSWRDPSGQPLIAKATPVLYSWGLFYVPKTKQLSTVRVVGIHLKDVFEVNAFKKSLFYETYYPATTSLEEQQQPVLGRDEGVTFTARAGDQQLHLVKPLLPPAYANALEQARRQGVTIPAPDEVPSSLSQWLMQAGLPAIPGLYDGEFEAGLVGTPHPGLIIGRDLVARRMADGKYDRDPYVRGEPVRLTLWATSASGVVDPMPVEQPFRYADDSRTGVYEIDSQYVYCDFDLLQKLLQMQATPRVDSEGNITGTAPARCAQIQVKLVHEMDQASLSALTARMRDTYHAYISDPRFDLDLTDRQLVDRIDVKTWQQTQAHIIVPVEKERILVTILFGIISLVAVTLILCILYMIVLQKTRDIGIVKAVGGSSGGVAFIFVIYGAAVGIAGAILGTTLGTLFVWYVNEIQDFLIRLNPAWRVWDLSVYSFDTIPNEVSPWDVAVVVLFAILASTLGSLGAAWRAGRMQPVEAIRHE